MTDFDLVDFNFVCKVSIADSILEHKGLYISDKTPLMFEPSAPEDLMPLTIALQTSAFRRRRAFDAIEANPRVEIANTSRSHEVIKSAFTRGSLISFARSR